MSLPTFFLSLFLSLIPFSSIYKFSAVFVRPRALSEQLHAEADKSLVPDRISPFLIRIMYRCMSSGTSPQQPASSSFFFINKFKWNQMWKDFELVLINVVISAFVKRTMCMVEIGIGANVRRSAHCEPHTAHCSFRIIVSCAM